MCSVTFFYQCFHMDRLNFFFHFKGLTITSNSKISVAPCTEMAGVSID